MNTGARPGRPVVRLVTTAGLLVGTLGLAWLQVRTAGVLTPELRVGGTPLRVRLPRGWQVDPRNPQRFLLPVAERGRRAVFEFERRIEFEFVRLPTFQPPEVLLRLLELGDQRDRRRLEAVRLGPYPAMQVQRVVPVRIGRIRFARETVIRLACLPRGHLIKLVYEPLSELRPADWAILEEVCSTVRVDEPTLAGSREEYLRRCGVEFPLSDDWLVVGADFAEVPGVYVSGCANGLPAWALAVFRTWLAAGRTPRDLLVDFAGEHWLSWDVANHIREQRRPDGVTVASLRHPDAGRADTFIPAAWVVARSASQAAMIFVYAGPEQRPAAEATAEAVAGAIEFAPLPAFSALPEAELLGVNLVRDLRKVGPAARWGREPLETMYRRTGRDEVVLSRRGAVRRDPNQGYEGMQWRRSGGGEEEQVSWTLDARAGAYTWRADFFHGDEQVRIVERRTEADGVVVRQVLIGRQADQRWTFTPGPGFVAPPAESVIKGWVARGEAAAAIVEVSSPLGPRTHTLLLRHVPLEDGLAGVLVQQDYWPAGAVEAYDDARAETEYELYPTAEYRRAN